VREALGEEHFALLHHGLGRPDGARKQGPDAVWRHSSREGKELLQRELHSYIAKNALEKQQHALLIFVFLRVVGRFEVEQDELRRTAAVSGAGGQGSRGAKGPAGSVGRRRHTSPQRTDEERMRKARAS
jgi:hypothetical protein